MIHNNSSYLWKICRVEISKIQGTTALRMLDYDYVEGLGKNMI